MYKSETSDIYIIKVHEIFSELRSEYKCQILQAISSPFPHVAFNYVKLKPYKRYHKPLTRIIETKERAFNLAT